MIILNKINTKGWLLMALLAICKVGYGQQEAMYSQYMFNTMAVNPAYAGTRNALNVLVLSRMQWVGLDGAPRTYTFSAHAPIENQKMGLGVSMVADKIGPVNNYYFNLNYAYHLKLTEALTLSMGLKAGIYNYYVGLNDLGQVNDPTFASNIEKVFQPNAGVGLYLFSNKFYAGFSIPKMIQGKLSDVEVNGSVLSNLKRHYFLMGGYVFNVNSDVVLKPSVIEKVVAGAPPSTDLTLQMFYKSNYWFGTTYRFGDAMAFMAGIQINRQLMFGYSYDITLSSLAGYNHGSHEIMISYDFDGWMKKEITSARYL